MGLVLTQLLVLFRNQERYVLLLNYWVSSSHCQADLEYIVIDPPGLK